MSKKKEIKRKNYFVYALPFLIFIILLVVVFAAVLRIGIGEAQWAGLVVSNLNNEMRVKYNISRDRKGVCVLLVQDQALNAGLKMGDLLVSINGKSVTNVSSFLKAARIDIAQGALLDIVRNNEPLYITLTDNSVTQRRVKKYLGLDARHTTQVALQTPVKTNAPAKPPIPVEEMNWLAAELEQGIDEIVIDDVPPGSPAEKAGFKLGDVITAFDGVKVTDLTVFNELTLNGKITTGTVEIQRGADTLFLFIPDEAPQGIGPKVAFSINKPLFNQGLAPHKDPVITGRPGPAASLPPVEGHWVGMETLNFTPQLAAYLNIPKNIKGVLIDEAVMEAQDAGFVAGDIVVKVGNMNTYNLKQFRAATRVVADKHVVNVVAYRKGNYRNFTMSSVWPVGVAQMETAQMIPKGSVAPHRYRGACTSCHTIGMRGQLAKDGGDLLMLNAPPIRAGSKAPHRNRGKCTVCHKIIR